MIAAALLLQLGLAAPGAPPPIALLESQTREYFAGEKSESYLWGGLGLAGVGTGALLLTSSSPGARSAAYPLLGVGLLQLALGAGLFLRTDPQVAALMELLHGDAGAFGVQESTRMARVNAGFRLYKVVELNALLVGAGLVGYGASSGSDRALGVGLGLAVEMVAMLALDHFADERAALYAGRLAAFGP